MKIFIGVVGQIASGKGRLVDCLIKEHGFTSFSLSSVVHDELRKQGITDFTRKTLQDIGDELRKKYGSAVLAKRAIEATRNKKKIVIEGIRNPAEVEYLKKLPDFTLVAIKSIRKLRYNRLLKRAKPWDPKTWNEFLVVDRRDLGIGQKASGQQVGKCLAYADFTILNNEDIGSLNKKIKKLLDKIKT